VQPTPIIIQELQTIKYIKATQHQLQLNSLSSLICYVITTTNKRYSYLRVAAIRFDVHPVGENSTNTPYVFHAQSMYAHRPYVSHVVHVYQPFMSHRQI
jgi:hypothetical protein